MRRTPFLTLVVLALVSLVAKHAAAQSAQDVALHVEAPTGRGCTSAERLARRVHDRVGRAVFVERASTQMLVRIEGDDATGWHAVLRQNDGGTDTKERALSVGPGPCVQLDDALVLVLSTAVGTFVVQPSARAEEPAPPPREQPREQPPPATPRRAARPREPWALRASLGAALGSGLLPAPFFGAAAGLEAQRRRLVVRVGLLALPHDAVALGAGARADFAALLARVSTCGLALRSAHHELGLCGGARVGPLWSRTRGLAETRHTVLAAAELELAARYHAWLTPHFGLYVSAAATVPLYDRAYDIVERDGLSRRYHKTNPGGTGELGTIVRWSL